MPRNPIGAVFLYPIGLVLTGAGIAALAWVALAFYKVEAAFDAALWVLRRPELSLTKPAEQLANNMIQRDALFTEGAIAAFAMLVGAAMLRAARTALRPANQSHDGKFEIALTTLQPRAGAPLEGNLRTLKDTNPGEVFRLDLSCTRDYSDDNGKNKEDVGFFESKDVKSIPAAQGSSIPFSFAIPAGAPASEGLSHLARNCYHWRLNVYRANALIATGSRFCLTLGPATAADLRAFEAARPAPLKSAIAAISARRAEAGAAPLQPHELEKLRKFSPEQLAALTKPGGSAPNFQKIVLIVFAAIFVLPIVIFILIFMIGAIFR